ncbi:exosome complex component CSL4 isoform X3 [Aquila chrysaetos chrysaetos]|uniref:exosome complex component CSL4 isoform X3 n=1 Tax=Aquila chrysaetos chrysaetos TaxID=223781 RepID=UPI00117669E6|nr:exosome complex component CSL4 isoform X3 [Aquila chrysaetos chrysaetos]
MAPPARYCVPGSAGSGHCGRGAGEGRPGAVRSLGPPGAGPGRTAPWQRRPLSPCPLGERLCSTEEATAGSGTYTRHGFIFSSLAGCLEKRSEDSGVCSINSRFAKVHILYVGSTPLKSTFRGTIRREDIRATEKDKVEVYKSFRPGDIVLAKVISLGDAQSNYLLSTAENELGVVVARSEAGVQMVPISWCEMQCPRTHTKDFRKVARVQPQFLQT